MEAYAPFTKEWHSLMEAARNPDQAAGMEAYMKNRFVFLGVTAPIRDALSKPYLAQVSKLHSDVALETAQYFWSLPEREYHYIAIEIARKAKRLWNEAWLNTFLDWIGQNSWWDTVDSIASNLVGPYLQPKHTQHHDLLMQMAQHEDFWYNRTAIIHQLKYKTTVNHELLFNIIATCGHQKEFFIQKAIGWSLRELSKTHPEIVKTYMATHTLSNLAVREGSKYI